MVRLGGAEGLIAAVLAAAFVLRQADSYSRTANERFVSEAALGLLLVAACGLYYVAGKIYCANWSAVAPKSVLRILVERAVLPAVTVVLLTRSAFTPDTMGALELSLLVLLMLSLMDLRGGVRRAVEPHVTEVSPTNRRLCYLKFPPKSRADIAPMDLLFFGLTFLLLLKRFT